MHIKLINLGLGVVAVLTLGALTAVSASATGTGHFTSGAEHTLIRGELEGGATEFTDPTLPTVTCVHVTYEATTTAATETELTVFSLYTGCHTSAGNAHVEMNGCHYVFTINTHAETTHNRMHIACPGATKHITIRATNFAGSCTIKIPAQSHEGLVYTTKGAQGSTHYLTVDRTFGGVESTRHADGFGACLFASTTGTSGGLAGGIILKGFTTEGSQVSLTATGSTGA